MWMRTYTLIMAVIIPILINSVLNTLIFAYVKASSRRLQSQPISTTIVTGGTQSSKISRRDISLLRQMAFTFFHIYWRLGPCL